MIPVDGILSKRGHSNTSQNQVKLELEQQQFLLFAMKIGGTHRSRPEACAVFLLHLPRSLNHIKGCLPTY